MTNWFRFTTPLGPMLGRVSAEGALLELNFRDEAPAETYALAGQSAAAAATVARQIEEYFRGARTEFSIALAPPGTAFQKQVWECLARIPYGHTRSYGELARDLGNANASRAVGRANATNPIAIIVPCHRVIGSNGSLTGYAAGTTRKDALLRLERGLLPF